MLKLRAYHPADGDQVASWVTDEWTLRVWSAACYEGWPVTGGEINAVYENCRKQYASFRSLIAEEDGVPVGHMMLHYMEPDRTTVHFGFVIVNPACRGKGVGTRMLRQAMELAFGEMDAEKVELYVFTCNERAHRCYLALGFRDVREAPIEIGGTVWPRWYMETFR